MMPKLSLMTLARGARQLVVQEALLWRQNRKHNDTHKLYKVKVLLISEVQRHLGLTSRCENTRVTNRK